MQMAVEPEAQSACHRARKDAKAHANDGCKRHPLLHVLDLGSGAEVWKNELSEVELMPSHWPMATAKLNTLWTIITPRFLPAAGFTFSMRA